MIRVILGFLLMLGGVGGIESSTTNDELTQAVSVALLGLILFYFGMKDQERTQS